MTKIRLQNQQSCVQQARATYQQTTVIWSQNTAAWEPKYYSTSFHLSKKKNIKPQNLKQHNLQNPNCLNIVPRPNFPHQQNQNQKPHQKNINFASNPADFQLRVTKTQTSQKNHQKTPTLVTKRVQKCLKKRYLAFIEINSITSSHETSTSLSTECRKTKSKTSI
jgi:hypothetical protein